MARGDGEGEADHLVAQALIRVCQIQAVVITAQGVRATVLRPAAGCSEDRGPPTVQWGNDDSHCVALIPVRQSREVDPAGRSRAGGALWCIDGFGNAMRKGRCGAVREQKRTRRQGPTWLPLLAHMAQLSL